MKQLENLQDKMEGLEFQTGDWVKSEDEAYLLAGIGMARYGMRLTVLLTSS